MQSFQNRTSNTSLLGISNHQSDTCSVMKISGKPFSIFCAVAVHAFTQHSLLVEWKLEHHTLCENGRCHFREPLNVPNPHKEESAFQQLFRSQKPAVDSWKAGCAVMQFTVKKCTKPVMQADEFCCGCSAQSQLTSHFLPSCGTEHDLLAHCNGKMIAHKSACAARAMSNKDKMSQTQSWMWVLPTCKSCLLFVLAPVAECADAKKTSKICSTSLVEHRWQALHHNIRKKCHNSQKVQSQKCVQLPTNLISRHLIQSLPSTTESERLKTRLILTTFVLHSAEPNASFLYAL